MLDNPGLAGLAGRAGAQEFPRAPGDLLGAPEGSPEAPKLSFRMPLRSCQLSRGVPRRLQKFKQAAEKLQNHDPEAVLDSVTFLSLFCCLEGPQGAPQWLLSALVRHGRYGEMSTNCANFQFAGQGLPEFKQEGPEATAQLEQHSIPKGRHQGLSD